MPRRAYARVLRAASAAASGKRIRYPSARAQRDPARQATRCTVEKDFSLFPFLLPHPRRGLARGLVTEGALFPATSLAWKKYMSFGFSIDSQRSGVFGRELAVHSRTKRRQLTPVRRGADGSGLVLSCECDTELVLQ